MRGGAKRDRTVVLRRRLLLAGWLAAGLIVMGRASQLQVLEGAVWRSEAEKQHRETSELPAPRGAILDRNGVPLAVSHLRYRVSVAPHELADRDHAGELLRSALDLSRSEARKVVQSKRRWVVLRGDHPPEVRETLGRLRGVYLEPQLSRFYPHGELARGVLGTVSDGSGAGGIEQAMDSILGGLPGKEIRARDSEGRPIPGQSWLLKAPQAGGDVQLTLDLDLQEIVSDALREAIETTEAQGGDILVTDPETGEILAMASAHRQLGPGLGVINTPFEPGSTLKPFTVAALLNNRVARLADSVDTEAGYWSVAGRTVRDVHAYGKITVADALRVSSNVGIAKVAQGLTPAQQYENLRDFGFGVPTGVSLPGEAGGVLRRPDAWSRQSAVSLAIGYEISTTPLQMAMAYGALANGGKLMEPLIVRETRGPTGEVTYRFRPRTVRKVVPEHVTRRVNRVLVDVVEEGTGKAARLNSFSVAGKSGTSRAYGPEGGYDSGDYYSSFAGFFPAEDPQLVIFVKLDRPRGAYFGGTTAAPVIRATMEAVLAARRPPIDRRALATLTRTAAARDRQAATRFASFSLDGLDPPVALPPASSPHGDWVAIPSLGGLPVRTAARRLHQLGFRAVWGGAGLVSATRPSAGSRLAPGDTVTLVGKETR